MNFRVITICLLTFIPTLATAQGDQTINRTDRDGKKQGHWIKKYPNGHVMYDGYFKNDKPIGEFKGIMRTIPQSQFLYFRVMELKQRWFFITRMALLLRGAGTLIR